jgi:hypothetical protein
MQGYWPGILGIHSFLELIPFMIIGELDVNRFIKVTEDVVMDDGAAVAAPAGVAWNPHRAREAKATSPAKVAPTESFQRHFVMVGLHPSRRESDGSSAKTATHLR